ncbi:MAG TPA: PilZ domain-containing protein [Candidatus Polarisedimenticolaceae bacterium]|nr:PilZ domain-containing protein [Candidatus Polarisedimenticolaceae bacterium]
MSKTTVERRTSPRKARSFELHGRAEAGEFARMTARDLSLGGMYCTSSADFAEMTRLAVTLLLPDGHADPLDLEAVVVRRKEVNGTATGRPRFELALFFHALTDAQRSRLASFLES